MQIYPNEYALVVVVGILCGSGCEYMYLYAYVCMFVCICTYSLSILLLCSLATVQCVPFVNNDVNELNTGCWRNICTHVYIVYIIQISLTATSSADLQYI